MSIKYQPPQILKRFEKAEKSWIFVGRSMLPTLRYKDVLRISPYRNRKIKVGDVVVFQAPDERRSKTHRVIAVRGEEIRTRGDNSGTVDPYVLHPENIVGRVVCIDRGGKTVGVSGGVKGRFYGFSIRFMRRIRLIIFALFHPFYKTIAKYSLFKKGLSLLPETRILSFSRKGEKEFILIMGDRVIGRRASGKNKWQIPRPFKWLFDEASLPK